MSQRCPNCKLTSPPDALRCDCGYDFVAGKFPVSAFPTRKSGRLRTAVFLSVFIAVLLFTALEMMSVFAHGGRDPSFNVPEAVANVLLLPAYPLGAIDRHVMVPEPLYDFLFIFEDITADLKPRIDLQNAPSGMLSLASAISALRSWMRFLELDHHWYNYHA
jgi:hypothetical protein